MKFDQFLPIVLLALAAPMVTSCGSSQGDGGTAPQPAAGADTTPAPDQTRVIHHGVSGWRHWDHPDFARPTFNWQWDQVKSVTCSTTDSRGHSYPVTDDGYRGQEYQNAVAQLEDTAMDRCHQESRGDQGCRFGNCAPEYDRRR